MKRGPKTDSRPIHLWLDQYGHRVFARSAADLRRVLAARGVTGRMQKMYQDRLGVTYHVGYIIGQCWFSRYSPVEVQS